MLRLVVPEDRAHRFGRSRTPHREISGGCARRPVHHCTPDRSRASYRGHTCGCGHTPKEYGAEAESDKREKLMGGKAGD